MLMATLYTNVSRHSLLIAHSQTNQLVTKSIALACTNSGRYNVGANNWNSKRYNSSLVNHTSFQFKNQSINSAIISKTLYVNQPQLNLILTRNYSDKPKDSNSVSDPKATKTDDQVAVPKKKVGWIQWLKQEALHYWHGFKLLGLETRVSSKLLWKMAKGYDLSRREQRQLKRTIVDLFRLVPFAVFIIIPFMELLLPFALKLFPNMLPSTFESQKEAEAKRAKLFKTRLEVSNFLQGTVQEAANAGQVVNSPAAIEFGDLFHKVRNTGQQASTEELIRLSKELNDDLTLDHLSRPQLVSICRYMGLNTFGTDQILAYQIRNRMRYLRADDRMINAEGIDELTDGELTQACQSRGIRSYNSTPQRMRRDLQQWLDLNLKHKVPTTILIMMQAFSIPESTSSFSADTLRATLSSLPDELVSEAELTFSEGMGTATSKQKIEVIQDTEERIAEEEEQLAKEQAKKQQEEEKAAASRQAKKQEEEEKAAAAASSKPKTDESSSSSS